MNSTAEKVYQYGDYHEIIEFGKRTNFCNELNTMQLAQEYEYLCNIIFYINYKPVWIFMYSPFKAEIGGQNLCQFLIRTTKYALTTTDIGCISCTYIFRISDILSFILDSYFSNRYINFAGSTLDTQFKVNVCLSIS